MIVWLHLDEVLPFQNQNSMNAWRLLLLLLCLLLCYTGAAAVPFFVGKTRRGGPHSVAG